MTRPAPELFGRPIGQWSDDATVNAIAMLLSSLKALGHGDCGVIIIPPTGTCYLREALLDGLIMQAINFESDGADGLFLTPFVGALKTVEITRQ